MSSQLPARPRHAGQRRTIAIVSSEYHPELVQGLVDHAERELSAISSHFEVPRYSAPGAFEVPLLVQEVAQRLQPDAIIALGVIIEGQTQHARLIGEAVTRSLQEISLRSQIPVLHEVLLVKDEAQARQRCLDEELNRGAEAARAAVRMMQTLSEVRARR